MPETLPEIQPVSRREWWPDAYVDEVMPCGRATPSDWLMRLAGGGYAFGDPEDERAPIVPLQEGQVVEFTYSDRLGTSRVTVDAEGGATWSPPLPPGVNHLWCDNDPDTMCDTPAMFAEMIGDRGEDEEFEVADLMHVGERNVRCRFTAAGGVLRFLLLDPEPAPPAEAVEAARMVVGAGDLFAVPSSHAVGA